MPRYVVQEHFTDPHHFDVMLERGPALATWSAPQPPEAAPEGQEATRIGEHRMIYLEYEGEIGGGRGRVRIHDRGTYDEDAWNDAEVRVTFSGARLSGRWRILALGKGDARGRPLWRLERLG